MTHLRRDFFNSIELGDGDIDKEFLLKERRKEKSGMNLVHGNNVRNFVVCLFSLYIKNMLSIESNIHM